MSDFDTYLAVQRAKRAEGVERLQAVLSAGENAGLWRVLPDEYAGTEHGGGCRNVETDDGRYVVSLAEGRIGCRVATLSERPREGGIRVFTSDVRDVEVPTATVAAGRDPATVARELHRRVIVPGAELARALRAELHKRVEMRAALRAHVDALRAAGGDVPPHMAAGDTESYEARVWFRGLGSVRVTAQGKVYVERATVRAEDVPALLALTERGAA